MSEKDDIKAEWAKRMPSNLVLEGCFVSKHEFRLRFRGVPDLLDEDGKPLVTEIASDRRKRPLCTKEYGVIEHVADCYARMRILKGQSLPN